MAQFGKRPSAGEMLLQHLIVFAVCIVFPGLTTFFLPASWLFFTRTENGVECTARTCVYFVVPYNAQHIDRVQAIHSQETSASTRQIRKGGRATNDVVHVDGKGVLEIVGPDQKQIEVSVSPASLESAVEKCKNFLNDSSAKSTTVFVIANWKFGGIMGGVLTCFTALYVVSYSIAVISYPLRKLLPRKVRRK